MSENLVVQDSKRFAKLNIFYGEDKFGAERAKKDLINKIVSMFEGADLNQIDAKECEMEEVLLVISSISMFSPARVVTIDNFEAYNAASVNRFISTINSVDSGNNLSFIPDGTFVIVISSSKTQPAKKINSKIVNYVEFKKKYERDAFKFINDEVKANGLKISRDACELLISYVGMDFQTLETEIIKLCTYVGKTSKEITHKDVLSATASTSSESIFDLCDYVASGDPKNALLALEDLMYAGEVFQTVQGMLASHIRGLIEARSLLDNGMPEYKAIDMLSGGSKSNFRVKKFVSQAKSVKIAGLQKAMMKLAQTDLDIKSGNCEPKLAAKLCVDYICNCLR